MGGKGKSKSAKVKADSYKTMERLAKVDAEKKVWLGDLPKGLDWKALEKHIEETCGTKPSVTNVMAYGKGVCSFKTADEASAAIAALNGTELNGKTIQADVWTQKEKKA